MIIRIRETDARTDNTWDLELIGKGQFKLLPPRTLTPSVVFHTSFFFDVDVMFARAIPVPVTIEIPLGSSLEKGTIILRQFLEFV